MNSYKINLIDKTSVDLSNTSVTIDELRSMITSEMVIIVNGNTLLNMKYVVSIKQLK